MSISGDVASLASKAAMCDMLFNNGLDAGVMRDEYNTKHDDNVRLLEMFYKDLGGESCLREYLGSDEYTDAKNDSAEAANQLRKILFSNTSFSEILEAELHEAVLASKKIDR